MLTAVLNNHAFHAPTFTITLGYETTKLNSNRFIKLAYLSFRSNGINPYNPLQDHILVGTGATRGETLR